MIEISLGKLVLLALIALIVLGPEKLPGAARTAGALLRRVRSGWDNVRAEVERELEIEEIKRTAREAAAQAEAAQHAMKDTLQQAHAPLADAAAMLKDAPAGDALTGNTPVEDGSIKDEPSAAEPVDAGQAEAAREMQAELPFAEASTTPSSTREFPHGGA
ncbi:MAG: Sec-independent protein translocase protein TatB [Rhodanobacter sp.]